MNNNINLDEIRKLANMIDVFANCLQQDVNQHCDEREIGKTVRYNDFCSYGERKDGAD